ncbi:MAG: hypothetical protein KAS36_17380 [Anaerolineales bacterium]|nr:hypothetical protein [Anaerolineales bacterium]
MFEPGQKVMVVKSNFDKKTGPRVGSIGFVSNFNINFYGLRFNRIVWYRFGNQETHRMESGPFGMLLPTKDERFPVKLKDIGCRRGGTLVPIFEKKKIEDMESLEFNCWLYSIMRLYRGHRASEKIRNRMSFAPVDFSPKVFSQHKFQTKNRIKLAGFARELRLIAFKSYKADTQHSLIQVLERIDRLRREGYKTKAIIENIIVHRGARYEHFFDLFTRIIFLNVVGQMTLDNINNDSHPYNVILRPMWQEWRKLHEISG